MQRRLTPHPLGSYESPLKLANPVGNERPCTYIRCTDPAYGALEASRQWVADQPSWQRQGVATGHDAMVTAPRELAQALAATG